MINPYLQHKSKLFLYILLSIVLTSCMSEKTEFSTVLDKPIPLSNFSLIANNGSIFNTESLREKWSLLFFGYTHCPDVCPLTLHQLSQANKELKSSIEHLPNIIMISVDPDRDTTEILDKYVTSFAGNVIGASGSIAEIKKLTGQLGIFFEAHKNEGENYSVSHSAAVILINKEAEFHAIFSAPHNTDHFIKDLPKIL